MMKKMSENSLVIVVTALVTMAVAVALWTCVPGATAAGPNGPAKVRTLDVEGVALTLQLDKAAYKAGEKPIVTLRAVNTRDRATNVQAVVVMSSMSPASMVSRSMPAPAAVWSTPCRIALGPNETRTIELPTKTALPAGSLTSFVIHAGGNAIAAGSVSTPGIAVGNSSLRLKALSGRQLSSQAR